MLKLTELQQLATDNGWHLTHNNGTIVQYDHPTRGAIIAAVKHFRRRQSAVTRIDFYQPAGNTSGFKYTWKASLSTPGGNLREAADHFLQGRGITTRKAS